MEKKTFKLTITPRQAMPRSKRLQRLGLSSSGGSGASSSVIIKGSASATAPASEGHTHPNKSDLDKLSTDTDRYLYISGLSPVTDPESEETTLSLTTEKAKAGFADRAAVADVAHTLSPDSPTRLEFLSRIADDIALGRITFAEGLQSVGAAVFESGAEFGEFVSSLLSGKGAAIDPEGHAEVESLRVRSFLQVYELIYNRLNALEGITSFSDSGTIETLTANPDGSACALMRRRWAGDFTTFKIGDIIYGFVNDLSAGIHGKAWARVTAVDTAANTLTLVPYAGADVPSGVNLPLAEGMLITRHGNTENPDRQQSFLISCDDGCMAMIQGAYSPKNFTYGATFGRLPEGLIKGKPTSDLDAYIYARGAVVQDLIRVDYQGAVVREAVYAGQWSQGRAYRSTDTYYHTVSYQGILYMCLSDNTTSVPSVSSPFWATVAGDTYAEAGVWSIMASPATLRLKADGVPYPDESGTIPTSITPIVMRTSPEGVEVMSTQADLSRYGVSLWAYIYGSWQEVNISPMGIVEMESGADVLMLEDDTAVELEGSRIPVNIPYNSSTPITLQVRRGDDVLAAVSVPLSRDGGKGDDGAPGVDGQNGKDGKDGLLAYSAGIYRPSANYDSTADSCPIVMYEDTYYRLRPGKTWTGADHTESPQEDYASRGAESYWVPVEQFDTIFARIVMAEFGRLGSAVFYGDYMISALGKEKQILSLTDLEGNTYSETRWVASENFQRYKTGEFIPNFELNLRTGEFRTPKLVVSDDGVNILNEQGKPQIRIGSDDGGAASIQLFGGGCLQTFDASGNLTYTLDFDGLRQASGQSTPNPKKLHKLLSTVEYTISPAKKAEAFSQTPSTLSTYYENPASKMVFETAAFTTPVTGTFCSAPRNIKLTVGSTPTDAQEITIYLYKDGIPRGKYVLTN